MTNAQLRVRAGVLARDLLEIAENAMPDTYLATDARVKHARETIALLTKKKGGPRGRKEKR